MKTKLSSRILSLLLCLVMCVSLMPAEAFAEADFGDSTEAEEPVEEVAEPAEDAAESTEPTEEPPAEPEDADIDIAASETVVEETASNEAANSVVASGNCGPYDEDSEEYSDSVTWVLDDEGTLTISGTGAMADYDYNTFPWVDSKKSVIKVVVESSVTSIGSYAFYYCTSLTSVSLPDSLTSIGVGAFEDCMMDEIVIPEGIQSIGDNTFNYCTKLASVTLPNSLTSIGNYAFYACSALDNLVLPDHLTEIGSGAFTGCTSLKEITIPDSVTSIGKHVFNNCQSVASVKIGAGLTSISNYAFHNCLALTEITIPSNVTRIGDYAFAYCSNLKEVTFEGNAPTFGSKVFQDSTPTVYYPTGNTTWTSSVMQNYGGTVTWTAYESTIIASGKCGENAYFTLDSEGVLTIYGTGPTYDWTDTDPSPWQDYCQDIMEIVIEKGITGIGNFAFYECGNMSRVSIGADVTEIGDYSFWYCDELTKIDLPDGLLYIRSGAFALCNKLSNVQIPDKVTWIGAQAFSGCKSLTKMNIPASVTSIGEEAFYDCSLLKSITVDEDNSKYSSEDGVLFNYDKTILIVYPAAKTEETYYSLPSSVTRIRLYAFYGNSYLESLSIPASVRNIEMDAFADCSGLKEVYFKCDNEPDNTYEAPSIGSDVFYDDTLTAYYPDDVTGWTNGNLQKSYGGTVTWTGIPVFRLGQDNNSFTHNNKTGDGFEGVKDYTIDEPYYSQFKAKLTETEISILDNAMLDDDGNYDTWGGSCYGLCATMGLASKGQIDISDLAEQSAEDYYHLPRPCEDAKFLNTIQFYHDTKMILDKFLAVACCGGSIVYNDNVVERALLSDFLKQLVQFASTDAIYILGITKLNDDGECGEGHALLVTGCTYNASLNQYEVQLYDVASVEVSESGKFDTMYINKDFSAFHYDNRPLGMINNSTFAIMNVYDWKNTLDLSAKEEFYDGRTYLNIRMDGRTTITNAEGETLNFTSSECSGTMNVYSISPVISDDGVSYIIETDDSASFTIVNSGSNLDISVYNKTHYMSIQGNSTANTTIRFGNGITVEGTDSTFRAFIQTDADSDGKVGRIAVSGHATSDVTITMDGNNVTMTSDEAVTDLVTTDYIGAEIIKTQHDSTTTLTVTAGTSSSGGSGSETVTIVASGTCGENLTWTLDENGLLTISGTGAMTNWTSSSSMPWYSYIDSIKTVTIESGVTTISAYAFDGCSSLTGVTIADGVTEFGDYAFYNCSNLTNVTIPEGVTSIGYLAFAYCEKLTDIRIPASVTKLYSREFFCCTSLTAINVDSDNQNYSSLDGVLYNKDKTTLIECPIQKAGKFEIPDGVTAIDGWAFENCRYLTDATIPASVTSIGVQAFAECSNLTAINVVSENSSYSSLNGVLFNKDQSALIEYPGGKAGTYEIPDSVTEIGECAFLRCNNLTSVTIPKSVTSIGNLAFHYCSKLTSVTFQGSAPTLGSKIFNNDTLTVYYPACGENWESVITEQYGGNIKWVSVGHTAVTDAAVVPTCTETGLSEGSHCSVCGEVITAQEVIAALGHDFENHICTRCGITEASVIASGTCGDNLTWTLDENGLLTISGTGAMTKWTSSSSMPWYAYIDSIKTVTIESGVTTISSYTFFRCSSLTEVTIPASVTSIGNSVFTGCQLLTDIIVDADNNIYSSDDGVLFNKERTELIVCPKGKAGSYTIPYSVITIKSSAFYGCSDLTDVTIPDSVTSIGNEAFYSCSSLTNVAIPASVTSISNNAFSYCSGLASMTIPDSVTSIDWGAFYYCSSLASVTIPESVTSIGSSAFYGCSSLTNVTIPASVTSIGVQAFSECSNLREINVESENSSYSSLNGVLFNKNQSTLIEYPGGKAEIYEIPDSVTAIGERAFFRCSSLTNVTIPASVTSIGPYAFGWCSGLTSVMIPDSVTSIGDSAFWNCIGLTSVTIPKSVTNIGPYAFSGDGKLTSVTFLGSAPTFGSKIFNNDTLTIYYPAGDDIWASVMTAENGGTVTWIAVAAGDVNADGSVNLLDLLVLKNALAEDNIESLNQIGADINNDSDINLKDLLLLKRTLASVA